jgi:D-alanine-D-alanine ligase
MPLQVLHLVGSAVSDFYTDLSLLYARGCLRATADPERYETHIAYITPDRSWRFPANLGVAAIAATDPMPLGDAVAYLEALEIDVMVPHMFCVPGMTHYRALFDLLGIPYVGNTSEVMALTSHKARTRAVVAAEGVDVPEAQVIRRGGRASIAPPVVVKPVDADNSIGVELVRDRAQYERAVEGALAHADEALVEAYIDLGREVRCGIVVADGKLVCLPLEEYAMDSALRPIRSYDDKLRPDGDGELEMVSKGPTRSWIVDPDDPITERVWEVAMRCHVALGCRHYSLFDIRIDPSGRPWFIEAGLYCSFSDQSVICMMATAAGVPTDELFSMALANVLETFEVKR